MLLDKDVTFLANQIMNESKKIKFLSEKFVQDNQPSIEINDFLSDTQNLMFQLEQMFFKNTSDRNSILEKAVELIQQIKDRADLSIEKLKQSSPEDENK